MVNFWASWCIPCREEAPLLEDASRRLASRGVTVLGIDHQDFAGDARGFVRKYGMTYPTVVDKGDKLYTNFGLTGVPETFCTNRAGKVVAHVPGAVTRETLDQCIQDASPRSGARAAAARRRRPPSRASATRRRESSRAR